MFFIAFRIVFFLIYSPQKEIPFFTYVQAIILGIRFDATSIAYLLLPIWIIVCISSCPFTKSKLNMVCGKFIPRVGNFIKKCLTIPNHEH